MTRAGIPYRRVVPGELVQKKEKQAGLKPVMPGLMLVSSGFFCKKLERH